MVFEAASEEDTNSEFEESVINRQMKSMVIFFFCNIFHDFIRHMKVSSNSKLYFPLQKVDSEPPRRGRRSTVLKVAMTFPSKKQATKRPVSEPLPQPEAQDSNCEEEENFMNKRAMNIKENKEMVQFTDFFFIELLQKFRS